MAEVILIQPHIGDWDAVRSHYSLPLALLAACRIVAKTFEVSLIDTRVNANWKKHLLSELEKQPICVGVTAITGRQIKYALEISQFVKNNSNVPVVWGGIHASLFPYETIQNDNIDFVIKGEGEYAFMELVMALKDNSSLEGIAGLWYKKDNVILNGGERKFCNFDTLGKIPYNLIVDEQYCPLFMGRRTLNFETSRGCPEACTYCYNKSYNNRSWRSMSSGVVIDHLEHVIRNNGISSFYFIDDNFFVDLGRARSICEEIIRRRLDIYWEAQGITIHSALKMNDEYIAVLEKSGLKKIHFGVETGSERILNLVQKNISIADIHSINKKFSKHNIVLQYNFMSGFPTETIADLKKTIKLCFDLMENNPNALISPICPYTPYPGTELYQQAVDSGFIMKKNLEDWVESDYGDNIWYSKKRMTLIKKLFFASMFLDTHRAKHMINSSFLKLLINTYRPIAKLRLKFLFFSFMPEFYLYNAIFRK